MKARHALLLITLATVLAVGVTGSMGLWQLRRAAAKEALAQAILEKSRAIAGTNVDLLAAKNIADLFHRRMQLEGHWLPAHTVYLENRQMQGVPGFVVVTPLQLEGGGPLLLVQRGWVQRDFQDRTRLPVVPTPQGLTRVSGRLEALPGRLYEPAMVTTVPSAQAGPIRQNLDVTETVRRAGAPVLEASLLQSGDAADGLRREWLAPNLGVDKHYAYAAQWFAMSALLVGLYAWFQWIAPYVRTRKSQSNAQAEARQKPVHEA